jgi:hypothetical protein
MSVRDTEEYKNMSFSDMTYLTWNDPESDEEALAFWQKLVDTGVAWQLEGWFGRTAINLIEDGVIDPPVKKG